jgi:hypothetical protein
MWSKLHVDSGHVIKTAWLTVFVWSKLADSSHVIRNAWLTVVMWSELSGWLYSCDQNCLVDSSHVIRTAFSIHGITCTMKIAIMIYVFFFPTHVLSINFISLIFHYFSMSHFKALFTWMNVVYYVESCFYNEPQKKTPIDSGYIPSASVWSHSFLKHTMYEVINSSIKMSEVISAWSTWKGCLKHCTMLCLINYETWTVIFLDFIFFITHTKFQTTFM